MRRFWAASIPYGGFGRIIRLTLALFILQVIASGFNLLGFNQQLTLAFWGLTLLFVMAVKRFAPRWRWSRRQAATAGPPPANRTA